MTASHYSDADVRVTLSSMGQRIAARLRPFTATVTTQAGTTTLDVLALDSIDATLIANDRFHGQPVRITVRGAK